MSMKKISTKYGDDNSSRVDIKENDALVQYMYQEVGMVPTREDTEAISTIGWE